MIIVANINKIVALSEKEITVLNTLTPKDRLYIITDAGAMVPVTLFNILNGMKSKPEIVSLPDGADAIAEAFLYGTIVAGVKSTEDVTILSDMELKFPTMPNIKWVTTLIGSKNQKKIKAPTENGFTENDEEPAKRTRKLRSNLPENGVLMARLMKYPVLQKIEAYLSEKEADVTYCIQNASDSEIGLKFLLETRLGSEKGNIIWEAIHKDFETLKKNMTKTAN